MNTPIRRIATLIAALFLALFVSSTYIQVFQVKSLEDSPGNRRALLDSYDRERGSILVGSEPIAHSVPSSDELKYLRTYPKGSVYAPVTGYYSFTYGAGAGLERAEQPVLSGDDDSLFYRRLADVVTGRPERGASVETTLVPAAQEAAWNALAGRRGAAVAVDPTSGAILAMVSAPSYNPAVLASHDHAAVQRAWAQLNADPARPMVNRAIAGDTYPPGSTFKIITAATALESGRYTADTEIPSPLAYQPPQTDRKIRNFDGKACNGSSPTSSLRRSMEVSCNTSFAYLGNDLGADAVRQQAEAFGWGESIDVPMPVTPSRYPAQTDKAVEALVAIGQYDVRATPLQMAMVSAGVANDGVLMRPHLVRAVRDADLDVISQPRPQVWRRAVSPQTAQTLTEMLTATVDSGTGTAAQIPGVKVAGKTGTAEYGSDGLAHAWFTGFAPADDPKVAVAVIVESSGRLAGGDFGTGGLVAAPIAKQIMQAVIGQ